MTSRAPRSPAPAPPGRPRTAIAVLVAVVSGLTSACSFGPLRRGHLEETVGVQVEVVDERGVQVVGAQFVTEGGTERTGSDGVLDLDLAQPVAGVVSAPGKLDEPLVVAPGDDTIRLVLFDRQSDDGLRVAYHFGGDTMLGRRYQTAGRDGTAGADDAAGARGVVSDLAPIAAAADLTVVNVETVIGDLPQDQALSAKRFLISSPPQIVDALRAMGVDVVTLGNNHANDWGDTGVLSTLSALGPANIAHAGAGLTVDDATRGVIVAVGDRDVGIISATSVNGDFVNDQLPVAGDEPPADLPAGEAWQYDERTFAFGESGQPGYVAAAERRPGDAWRLFRDLEPTLSDSRAAELWSALTAPEAYPELQDWVARRGHGGAAMYDRETVASEIRRLRAEGAEQVIVQFHAGFQFSERPSSGLRRMAHDAIDDGADMVVSHHPHVLQGLEWYRGRLIAYSLGNLVFDQDFLTTYPSAMLRVVADRSGIVEARLIPVLLVDYRPVPAAGIAAQRILRLLDTRSALPGLSTRFENLDVGVEVLADPVDGATPVNLVLERNTGRIAPPSPREGGAITLSLAAGASTPLPACTSIDATTIPDGVEYGVDLFGWGAFDDVTADGQRSRPAQWALTTRSEGEPTLVAGPSGAVTDDALQIIAEANLGASARFVSRVPIEQHRWFDGDGEPVDAVPSHELEFDVKRTLGANPSIEIQVYHVADEDPTSDPESTLLRELKIPVEMEAGDWVHERIALDPDQFVADDDGRSADAAMVTFRAEPDILQTLQLDNVRFMEWRAAPATDVPIWVEADALRSERDQVVTVTATGCGNR